VQDPTVRLDHGTADRFLCEVFFEKWVAIQNLAQFDQL